MKVGIPKEICPGETRVAVIPATVTSLVKSGLEVAVEQSAGTAAGFTDEAYRTHGATVVSRADVFRTSDILLQVRATPGDPGLLRQGQAVIGFADPLGAPGAVRALASSGASLFSMELMPRITRAQSMDALSSMATIAGYKGVLLAANALPRMFPMLMTAAGTISPARVFVVGAGVAGLQAISAARRLGAKVEAYDVRPAVKEQVLSLGAKFVELALEAADAEDKGGYAKAQDESFYERQREMMMKVVAAHDVVITTALIPGRRAPILVTTAMVEAMAPGSVVVDLAAERGGNCELTRPDETVVHQGVTVLGPSNPPALVPYHASQMYSKNITTFLAHLLGRDGAAQATLPINTDDEITRETLLTRGGQVVHPRLQEQ
ncbi:MAG: NAD(P) transhydrogenase subunit alpha [Acidobacteria bacterium RIFCSPLOWO2_02_FULL_67_36]|nr:MAG: NAD(P) transhydrogenase subunit alpha [Acidobacteria bacterium RIFCSPLOWO2_02_FULL_67_36]OFW23057.1 MAG: NAD(P) transhydrogenase subunit alpha [Acidobacteria bacterium RIFCSPLOWO2_12_FULL_66_21]